MVKHVWKELKDDDMAVVTDRLSEIPEAQRPLYGITGIKTSLWSQIGGGAKPYIVVFMPDRIIISRRNLTGKKHVSGNEHPLGDLVDVSVRNGPMFDSAKFTFSDGFSTRVGNIPNGQIDPVLRFLEQGPSAFDWASLNQTQRTNCYFTFTSMGYLPADLL